MSDPSKYRKDEESRRKTFFWVA